MSFQADEFQAGASAASLRRAGPSRVSIEEQVPEFGPGQLIGEIDSAEKLVGEIDRQIRGVGNGVRHVVRRQTRDGSVQHEAGAGILAQAALGDDILGYTGTVAGRNTMNTGVRTFNPANDSAPLTHTHTRLVNVAVVERKRMPYSESGNRGSVFDDAEFEVQEATIVPKKAGLSILMFDICCAKGRQKGKPKNSLENASNACGLPTSGPEYLDPLQWDKKPQMRGWDPQKDYHLTRDTEALSLNSAPHARNRKDEPLRLGDPRTSTRHLGKLRDAGVEDPLIDQMREQEAHEASMRGSGWNQRGSTLKDDVLTENLRAKDDVLTPESVVQERHQGQILGTIHTSSSQSRGASSGVAAGSSRVGADGERASGNTPAGGGWT